MFRAMMIAVCGLMLIGAAPPTEVANKGVVALESIANELAKANAPKEIEAACETGENRASDLCAQWKAADAASGAAFWAMIGTIVAALGTFGLYWQIRLTRKAVVETTHATVAMKEANAIAREMGINQLRAYITIDKIDLSEEYRLVILLRNSGQTPAFFESLFLLVSWPNGRDTILKHRRKWNFSLAGNGKQASIPTAPLTQIDILAMAGKEHAIHVRGSVRYRDVGGIQRKTKFHFVSASGSWETFPEKRLGLVANHAGNRVF